MNKINFSILLVFLLFSAAGFASGPITPQEIVRRADVVRNPQKPFKLENKLIEYEKGEEKSRVLLQVFAKEDKKTGQYKNVVLYKEPARDLGKIVLLDGTKMWFYDPSSKSSVRISPQQRLIGQASEGDVVSVNFSKDYTARSAKDEVLDDADHKQRKCWHLNLVRKNPDAVYSKLEYWVEKDTFQPVKAKFYSDSGRLLKIAFYHNLEMQLGGMRPTEVIIIDAVDSKQVTTMNFSGYAEKVIPESWFQREYLSHLKVE